MLASRSTAAPTTENCSPAWGDDSGATAVEYGLLVALIAAVVITAVATLGLSLVGAFSITWP